MTINITSLVRVVQTERKLLTYFVLTRKNRPAVEQAFVETDLVLSGLIARSKEWDIEFDERSNQTIAGDLRYGKINEIVRFMNLSPDFYAKIYISSETRDLLMR